MASVIENLSKQVKSAVDKYGAKAVSDYAKSAAKKSSGSSSISGGATAAAKAGKSTSSNYTQDAEGKWYDSTTGEPLGVGSTNAEWSNANKYQSTGGTKGTSSDYGSHQSDLDRLTRAQRQAAVDQLKAARTKALANLDVQEQNIKPMYENARNQTSAASQQGARSFAEYLANRGLTNSGAAAQGEINRLSQLNNNLGNLATQEANAYRDIANQRTAIENDYVANLANANNAITQNYYNNLMNYNEQQRQYIQGLQNQALGQYANDYQAQINNLLAQGYSPNSLEVLQLQALRGNKSNNLYQSGQANALSNIQAGNINYNNAAALGMTVPQAEQYYQTYLAQQQAAQQQAAEALQREIAQQELTNQINLQKLANETAKTNYQVNKPYYKPTTAKLSGNSRNTGNTGFNYTDKEITNALKGKDAADREAWIMENAGYMTENQYIKAMQNAI